jgi:hypothetical protein
LRREARDSAAECERTQGTLCEAQEQIAALSQERDDLAKQLGIAREVLAEATEQEATGSVEEAVAEAIQGSPRLATFRSLLLKSPSRAAVERLAESLRPYLERQPSASTAPARNLRLPFGHPLSSGAVPAPRVALTLNESRGAALAAAALNRTT